LVVEARRAAACCSWRHKRIAADLAKVRNFYFLLSLEKHPVLTFLDTCAGLKGQLGARHKDVP